MPTTLVGITLYVFALFPGIAFVFALEGHRPSGKRSVLRETATVVFVSAVCAAIIALVAAGLALLWADFGAVLAQTLAGDLTWAKQNLSGAIVAATAALAVSTLLGFALGTKRVYDRLLHKLFDATIARDRSAWAQVLLDYVEDCQIVDVAATLKSGAWVSGTLDGFDIDPDPHPHRTIVLTTPQYRAAGSDEVVELIETDYLVIEAGDIETLQVSHKASTTPPSS